MTTHLEVIKQLVEALEIEANIYIDNDPEDGPPESMCEAITAGRALLEQMEKRAREAGK